MRRQPRCRLGVRLGPSAVFVLASGWTPRADLRPFTTGGLGSAICGTGLTAAATHRPDLILMDIQLAILDGYEATRRIKADAALRAIPVIAVTSYGLAGDADKARAAGCDAYISKPYSPR
jgi:CheY-like chemotaxis protein